MLKTFREGQLVTVASEGGALDGVVAHVASLVKVEVAVEEPATGPVFRTAHPKSLTPRDKPGPADDALRRLIHRGGATGHQALGGGSARGRSAHTRAAAHRPTGR
jgi:hypothetical protein